MAFPESPHPYEISETYDDVYVHPGSPRAIWVTFDARTAVEQDWDSIEVYDKNYNKVGWFTGTELAGKTLGIYGDTVEIVLKSDSMITDWGYAVTAVTDVPPTPEDAQYAYMLDPTTHKANNWNGYVHTSAAGKAYFAQEKGSATDRYLQIFKTSDGQTWELVSDAGTPGAPRYTGTNLKNPCPASRGPANVWTGNYIYGIFFDNSKDAHLWRFSMDTDVWEEMPLLGTTPFRADSIPGSVVGNGFSVVSPYAVAKGGDYITVLYRQQITDDDNWRLFMSVYKVGSGWIWKDLEVSKDNRVGYHLWNPYVNYYPAGVYIHGDYAHFMYREDGMGPGAIEQWDTVWQRSINLLTGAIGTATYLTGTERGTSPQLNQGGFYTNVLLNDYVFTVIKGYHAGGWSTMPTLIKWGPFTADAPDFVTQYGIVPEDNLMYSSDEHWLFLEDGKLRVMSVISYMDFADAIFYHEVDANASQPFVFTDAARFFAFNVGNWNYPVQSWYYDYEDYWAYGYYGTDGDVPVIYQPQLFKLNGSYWSMFWSGDTMSGSDWFAVKEAGAAAIIACRYYGF